MRIIIEVQEAPPGQQPAVTIQTDQGQAPPTPSELVARSRAVDAGMAPAAAGAVGQPTGAEPDLATDTQQGALGESPPQATDPSVVEAAAAAAGRPATDAGPAPASALPR